MEVAILIGIIVGPIAAWALWSWLNDEDSL
jgi:hypothetical protein